MSPYRKKSIRYSNFSLLIAQIFILNHIPIKTRYEPVCLCGQLPIYKHTNIANIWGVAYVCCCVYYDFESNRMKRKQTKERSEWKKKNKEYSHFNILYLTGVDYLVAIEFRIVAVHFEDVCVVQSTHNIHNVTWWKAASVFVDYSIDHSFAYSFVWLSEWVYF